MKVLPVAAAAFLGLLLFCGLAPFLTAPAAAETIAVHGNMETAVAIRDQRVVHLPGGVVTLRLKIPQAPSFTTGSNRQQISSISTHFSVEPDTREQLTDRYGNQYLEATWQHPSTNTIVVTTEMEADMAMHAGREPAAAYPVGRAALPADVLQYLDPSSQVQVDNLAIRVLASQFQNRPDLNTEADMVNAVLSWVVDNLSYRPDNGQYDALTTLENHYGECTGYSHLAMAILRQLGIPARLAAGISFYYPYEIKGPRARYSMMVEDRRSGFLNHTWIQVYFPGAGWVEYDPQGELGLVDTRRVLLAVAPDQHLLPEGRFVNTDHPGDVSAQFTEDYTTWVTVEDDKVNLTAEAEPVSGPRKNGVYMALAG